MPGFDSRPETALAEALEAAAARLVEGDFAALDAIAAQTESAVAALSARPAGRPALERLRAQAARNLELIAASRRGLSAGRQRVAELLRVAGGGGLYDQSGGRQALGGARPATIRRT
ncbi:MAG: hypothetical protein ACK4TB_09400 [Gemmobacter sp.]